MRLNSVCCFVNPVLCSIACDIPCIDSDLSTVNRTVASLGRACSLGITLRTFCFSINVGAGGGSCLVNLTQLKKILGATRVIGRLLGRLERVRRPFALIKVELEMSAKISHLNEGDLANSFGRLLDRTIAMRGSTQHRRKLLRLLRSS